MRPFCFYIVFYLNLSSFGQEVLDTLGNASLKSEDSTTMRVIRLTINSGKSDFSPFLINNQLVFVSARDKNLGIQYVDAAGESEITDIYTSLRVDSIKYKNIRSFDPSINTNYYEGPFCFNSAGTTIYFTAADKKSGLLKIFTSEKINNVWKKPELMPFCLPSFSYCHPSISPNEHRMIFSSNTNGPVNKMDLYQSDYNKGVWSAAIPLDKKINDSTNQVFPFIDKNNTLYFSSDKKTGYGGLDIYYLNLNSDTSGVYLLPHPINSSADDFGVWVDSTSLTGYFSSNRNSRTKDDIYYFSKYIPDFAHWKQVTSKKTFCFTFFEETSLTSKDTLSLTYEWDFGDGAKGWGLTSRHCFASYGEYNVSLNIVDKVSGEVFASQTSQLVSIEKPDELVITCKDSIVAGEHLVFYSNNCYLKNYQLATMYWYFDDGNYNSGELVKHSYHKPGIYKVEMGLVAKNLISDKIEQFKVEKKITVTDKR